MYLSDRNLSTKHSRSGSALVAVFWLMSILGLAVFAAIQVVVHDVDIVSSQINGNRARQLAEMGLAVGAHPRVEKTDPLLVQTLEGGESFRVRITSEGKRFNINLLVLSDDRDLLRGMFVEWGLPLEDADALIDALKDWIDGNDLEELNGAEIDFYNQQGQPNFPYNRPFYNLDEVRLVRGMAALEELRPDWKNWFTVWSQGGLNINEAEPELIAEAAESTIEAAEEMVLQILGPDGVRDTEDDQPFQNVNEAYPILGVDESSSEIISQRLTTQGSTVRIESTGQVGETKRRITLVLRNRSQRPTILQRIDEIVP